MPPKKPPAGKAPKKPPPPPAEPSASGTTEKKKKPEWWETPATDSTPKPKSSKTKTTTSTSNETAGGSKGKGKASASTPPVTASSSTAAVEPPKELTTQELIGGKSWTGKLPQTLFYEHCIKNGWQKPEYTMKKEGTNDYISTVIIRVKNPKTRDLETISFRPPLTNASGEPLNPYQPTALQARHYCATYALHRVSSMKNVHMMLPPTHRIFWTAYEEIKKKDVKEGRPWLYDADPFLTKREQEAVEAARVAKIQKAKQEAAKGKKLSSDPRDGADRMKGWQNVPVIEMSRDKRIEVENLIKKHHVWNPQGVEMSAEEKRKVVGEMVDLGFRKAHSEEAVGWTKDREEALEWLLIHVPEDDLPHHFLPDNYSTGLTFTPGDVSLSQEYAAKRLSSSGYTLDLCREVLTQNDGDEGRAAEALMHRLLYGEQLSPTGPLEQDLISFDDEEADECVWEIEQTSLAAIWGTERYGKLPPSGFRLLLDISRTKGVEIPEKIFLEVRKPSSYKGSPFYPETIPVFTIVSEGGPKLPAHVRLSIIRQTAEYADSLKGEPMVFTIIDWLESNIVNIIENPGRLRDVASAITGSDERVESEPKPLAKRERHQREKKRIDWTPGRDESLRLKLAAEERHKSEPQKKMMAVRRSLPAWALKDDIVDAVNSAQVIIISGETGSGKSTQSVQFILDDMINRGLGAVANVICTQPRRISALGLADRVSDERCSTVGSEVGYAIRGESRQTAGVTKITFVTTGVLLRRLQMGDNLEDVSHVVVDEVHERSLDTDFLLILLKRMLEKRKDIKVVLMSATLDAEVFSDYFGGHEKGKVKLIHISGRTFPVVDFYLDEVIRYTGFDGGGRLRPLKPADEDTDGVDPSIGVIIRGIGDRINYNLIAATVELIDEEFAGESGGILIFLPGTMEIQRCLDAIRTLHNSHSRFHALPLHASLLSSEQRRVFPPPPKGLRKVIAATNVAETSITIEDIVSVIDTGRVKETSYDPENNMVKLLEIWASRAACKQRRGRAGRVRPGKCWKLYTRNAETNKMSERPEPELKRVPLEQTCLGVKAMGVKDVRAFLASALSPPNTMAVEGALSSLVKIGALVGDELTALGRHLSMIPADLRCSKLMVYGAIFGCLDVALTIASILTTRSPFVSPSDKREESKAARVKFAKNQGDLLADCRAYEEWAALRKSSTFGEARNWCEKQFLSHQTLMDITSNRSQYLSSLKDIGFLPIEFMPGSNSETDISLNNNNRNDTLIRALIAGAFTPQIARISLPEKKFASSSTGAVAVDPEARTIKYFTNENGRIFLHPSSTLFEAQSFAGGAPFLSFFTKVATSKVFLRDITPVNAYSLLLFGGDLGVDTQGRGITLDGWIRLRGWGRIGILINRLRMMLDHVLEMKIDNPGIDVGRNEVVACVRGLVEMDGA